MKDWEGSRRPCTRGGGAAAPPVRALPRTHPRPEVAHHHSRNPSFPHSFHPSILVTSLIPSIVTCGASPSRIAIYRGHSLPPLHSFIPCHLPLQSLIPSILQSLSPPSFLPSFNPCHLPHSFHRYLRCFSKSHSDLSRSFLAPLHSFHPSILQSLSPPQHHHPADNPLPPRISKAVHIHPRRERKIG